VTFQVLLIGGALMLVGFLYVLGVPSGRVQTVMVVSVAALTSFNLLLAVVLDLPFSGDVAVSSEPFTSGTLAQLNHAIATGR
jgi:hypothetical protein